MSISPQIHLHSMDSASVAASLNSNGGALLKAIEGACRDGAHLGMRGLARLKR